MSNFPLQKTYVKSFDGEKLYCVAQGELLTPTKTYLFINGIGGSLNAWAVIIEELLEKNSSVQCISYEHRGHSNSAHIFPRKGGDLITVLTRDLATICQFYKLQKMIFVGHSLGGILIQNYIRQGFQPIPSEIVLIGSPASVGILPNFLTKWSYRLLVNWKKLFNKNYKTMSAATHLKHKNSHDFSPFRVSEDISTTGLLPFLLYWLSILSWPFYSVDILKPYKPLLIFGERDLIVSKRKQKIIISILENSSVHLLATNHNAVVNEPKKIAKILNHV